MHIDHEWQLGIGKMLMKVSDIKVLIRCASLKGKVQPHTKLDKDSMCSIVLLHNCRLTVPFEKETILLCSFFRSFSLSIPLFFCFIFEQKKVNLFLSYCFRKMKKFLPSFYAL